jgi:hypothetical protein
MFIIETFCRVEYINPKKVRHYHEHKRMDCGRCQRGLAACEDTAGAGRESQKNARAENKKEDSKAEMEHLIPITLKIVQV